MTSQFALSETLTGSTPLSLRYSGGEIPDTGLRATAVEGATAEKAVPFQRCLGYFSSLEI